MKKKLIAVGAALCCVALIAVAVFASGRNTPAVQESPPPDTVSIESWAPASSEMPVKTSYSSSIIEGKTLNDLMQTSTLILVGKVEAEPQAFRIEAVGGGVKNFQDYTIIPIQVLRGNGEVGQSVTVRQEGGRVGNENLISDAASNLEVGKEYLMFLYQLGTGSGFNTQGDYYYINGFYQGVFEKMEQTALLSEGVSEADTPSETYFVNERFQPENAVMFMDAEGYIENGPTSGVVLPLGEFTEVMEVFNEEVPVDPDYFRNTTLENLRGNLDNGFISQEEYDRFVAELDEYARILRPNDTPRPDPGEAFIYMGELSQDSQETSE